MDKPKKSLKKNPSFESYRKQVEECLRKNEKLTAEETAFQMKGSDSDLRQFLEEGLPPLTAAKILIA
jgi:hypothetical protein